MMPILGIVHWITTHRIVETILIRLAIFGTISAVISTMI